MRANHQLGKVCASLVTSVLISTASFGAPPEMNFDADALSEVVAVGTDGVTQDLQWSALGSAGAYAAATALGTIGVIGNNLIPGNWLSTTAARIGVVALDAVTDEVTWKILDSQNAEQSVLFGTGDNLFISGGDFNGNGLGDGAIVNSDGTVLVKTDLFDAGVADSTITLPARIVRRGKGLFASPGATGDSVGFVVERSVTDPNQRYMLFLRDLNGNTIRTYSAGPVPRGTFEDVAPVATPNGFDAILYISRTNARTFLMVRDISGAKTTSFRISGTGEVVVGDYLANPGEEIGVETAAGLVVTNPFDGTTQTFAAAASIYVDHVNVHSFRAFGRSSGGGSGGTTAPPPGLDTVCSAVRELQECEIWKSIASTHITDQRASSTSFISDRGCAGGFPQCIPVYDSNGTQVHSLGQYFPTGSLYDNRHYGCFGCGDCKRAIAVAGTARTNTGSPEVYIKDNAGTCIRIPNANQCFNSSGC